jgi:hypothetical protein
LVKREWVEGKKKRGEREREKKGSFIEERKAA